LILAEHDCADVVGGDFVVAEVDVSVVEVGADAEQLEELTRALRAEILTLDVDSVVPRSGGEAPPGTRGVDAAAVGALVVSVAPALGALARLVTTVVDWLRRGGTQRTVRLKIGDDELELSGASSAMQQQLAMDWIRAHALE
jgi:hypothetical protein